MEAPLSLLVLYIVVERWQSDLDHNFFDYLFGSGEKAE